MLLQNFYLPASFYQRRDLADGDDDHVGGEIMAADAKAGMALAASLLLSIGGTAAGLVWIGTKEAHADSPPSSPPSGNCNVGRDNSGSVMCNNTFNAAPTPLLQPVGTERTINNPDGKQVHIWKFQVETPYPASLLEMWAFAPNISNILVVPDRTVASMGTSGIGKDSAYASLEYPFGRIVVQVTTINPEQVKLTYRLQ
jgi:hypothetical protein